MRISLAGNHLRTPAGPYDRHMESHGEAESLQPFWDFQLSCKGTDNSLGTFAVPGSSRAKGSRGGYGPWRLEPSFFKLKGGSTHSGLNHSADPLGSCKPRDPTGQAGKSLDSNHGGWRSIHARFKFDARAKGPICPVKQELWMSCQAYEGTWERSKGQQPLTDLKRMENVLHNPSSTASEVPSNWQSP